MTRRDYTYGSMGDCTITFDLLSPEGRIIAPTGSMHLDLAAATIYLKQTGVDEFGWVAVAGGGGSLPDGDYGDVTISGGGTLITINDEVITLDKLADMPSGYILGRTSPGTGDVELVPIASLTGTPGGANTQVQYNDGGAFGGDAGFVFDETNKALTVNGGTPTTRLPALNVGQIWNPTAKSITTLTSVTTTATATCIAHGFSTGDQVLIAGAVAVAYNGVFTITVTGVDTFTYVFAGGPTPQSGTKTATAVPLAAKIDVTNTAALLGSSLFELQSGGVPQFTFRSGGTAAGPEMVLRTGSATQFRMYTNDSGVAVLRSYTGQAFTASSREYIQFGGNGALALAVNNGQKLTLQGAATECLRLVFSAGVDLNSWTTGYLDIGAIGAGFPAGLRVANLWTNSTNYERGKFAWVSNVLVIGTEKLGTATARGMDFQTDGVSRLTVAATGAVAMAAATTFALGAYTVGTLPAAGTVGRTAYVTDGAAALAWGATVTGGAAVKYLVWDNGTAWTVAGK